MGRGLKPLPHRHTEPARRQAHLRTAATATMLSALAANSSDQPPAHLHERQQHEQGVVQAAGLPHLHHSLHHSVHRVTQHVSGVALGRAGCRGSTGSRRARIGCK
jgi:hypothetical protein